MKTKIFLVLSLLVFLSGRAVFGQDNSAAAIRERMLQRLDKIAELKGQGLIGENNTGYLQAVDTTLQPPQSELITQENDDRKLVYTAIASKQGTSVELVGKRRAMQIREQAKSGEYIMDAEGKWEKKK